MPIELTPEEQQELDAARGVLAWQVAMHDYHAAAFQTTDPITGAARTAPLPLLIELTENEQAAIDAARGQLPAQIEMHDYHVGAYQTTDPVTGEARPEPLPPLPGGETPPAGPVQTGIALTPTTADLLVGATQQFFVSAVFDDSSTQDVTLAATWDATGGTVVAGLFTAGATAGPYQVNAAHGGFTASSTGNIT